MTDLRYALRLLRKNPGFAALSVLALGLGIGATAAIFTVVESVLLSPLPFPDPDRLVTIWRATSQEAEGNQSAADFLDLQRQNSTFAHIAGFREEVLDLSGRGGDPERLTGLQVTAEFFDVLGMPPVAGRLFNAPQDRPGAEGRVVISDGLWERRFGRDPATIGRVLRLNDRPFTVVGVAPRGFSWPAPIDAWTLSDSAVPSPPLDVEGELLQDRSVHYFNAVGRLRPDVSLAQANQDLDRVARAIQQQTGRPDSATTLRAARVHEEMVGPVRPALYVLLVSVGFVLLIACANVASLLLARAAARQGEIAVRSAMGASRGRIVRQLLVESAVLGAAACVVGLVFAVWGLQTLLAIAPQDIPRLAEIELGLPVVGATMLLSVVTVVVFGIVPALQVSKSGVIEALKEGGRPGGGAARTTTRSVLVVGEIGLALVLLAGAGLMLTSLVRLLDANPGFVTENVVTISLPLPQSRYSSSRQAQFYRDLVDRLSQIPDTRNAAFAFPGPLSGSGGSAAILVEGRPIPAREDRPSAALAVVGPEYFRTMGIPVLQGRVFDSREASGEPSGVIVNATLARRMFPGENPLERRLLIGGEGASAMPIVGVVADVRWTSLEDEPPPSLYLSSAQFPLPFLSLFVRSQAEPARVGSIVRAQVAALDPSLPVDAPETMTAIVERTVAQPRFRATLLGAFALVALALAAIGVYGIVSQSVAQRVREIAVRLALGATPRQVLAMVFAQGVRLALIGVALGLMATLALARFVESLLFDVASTDPLTLAGAALLLLAVAACATWLPARRALTVDPMVALRTE